MLDDSSRQEVSALQGLREVNRLQDPTKYIYQIQIPNTFDFQPKCDIQQCVVLDDHSGRLISTSSWQDVEGTVVGVKKI